MALSIGILFAIITMFAYGTSDILVKKVTPKIGPYFSFLYRNLFITIFLFAYFFIFIRDVKQLILPWNVLVITLAMVFAGVIAFLAFCKGIEVGKVSIISPVGHASVIITVLLALIFFKEKLTLLQGIAIAIIIAGVITVSFKYSDLKKLKLTHFAKGMPYALVAAAGWGITFFLLKIPIIAAGPIVAALYLEGMALVYLIVALPFKKKKILPKKPLLKYIILWAVLTSIGTPALAAAIKYIGAALANPIAFASPFVAVVLAYLLLKERLEFNQLISVAAIIAGIIIIAL